MIDILEFRIELDTVENWFSINELFNDFVVFIELRSIFFGGVEGPDYLQGSVYCEKDQIDINSFMDDIILFFKKYNGIKISYMGINVDLIKSVNINYYKNRYNDLNTNFYYWNVEEET
jgi:hypothetical protein